MLFEGNATAITITTSSLCTGFDFSMTPAVKGLPAVAIDDDEEDGGGGGGVLDFSLSFLAKNEASIFLNIASFSCFFCTF